MSAFNVEVAGGSSVRLPTAGKYCDRDIIVTATGGGTPTQTQEKTVEIKENGTVDVTPDDGYALSKVTANVNVPIPDGYIKPSGTLDITSNGIYDVTEKANVLVSVPIREIYLQEKTIVKNGTYTADEGYDGLWKVTVNVESSGGGEDQNALLDAALNGSLTSIDSQITSLAAYACRGWSKLTTVKLHYATSIGTYAFYYCTAMTSISAFQVKTLNSYAFYNCSKLTSVNFPFATSIPSNCFYSCGSIKKADFGAARSIAASAFAYCDTMTALILRRSDAICTLANTTNALKDTPIEGGTGYVYVPASLLSTYSTATNWSNFANQFRAIEDYPDIC